jgi:hypothetical protein
MTWFVGFSLLTTCHPVLETVTCANKLYACQAKSCSIHMQLINLLDAAIVALLRAWNK